MYITQKNIGMGQATSTASPSLAQGISSILTPIVQAGTNIFLMEEQAKLQENLLKSQQAAAQPVAAPVDTSQQTLILVVAGIGFFLILMMMLLNRSSSSGVQVTGSASGSQVTGSSSGGHPMIIKKIVRRLPDKHKRRR